MHRKKTRTGFQVDTSPASDEVVEIDQENYWKKCFCMILTNLEPYYIYTRAFEFVLILNKQE